MQIEANRILNPNHTAIHQSTSRELLVYGGAGAGKSYSIADKLLLQAYWQPNVQLRAAIVRRTLPSLRRSSLHILETRAKALSLPFVTNKADWTAKCRNLNFLFLSINNAEDFEKLKSLTDIDFIWINELPQLREPDYDELLRRLRGGQSTFQQIICDFNPIGKKSWVYKRFWGTNIHEAEKLRYTVLDNHPDFLADPKTQAYIANLQRTKSYDQNYYNIYFLGEWGELKGVIYDWDVVSLPEIKFDEIFYGGDFGFSVDPAAVVKIYRKADEYWLEELIYETELTNQDLAARILRQGVKRTDCTYWDSAEPKSIEELCRAGINALPARKGADSVRAGIDLVKSKKVHIVDGSENIIREKQSYVWKKDKDGNSLDEPIGRDDHFMSAIRYAIATHEGPSSNVKLISCSSAIDDY